MDQKDKAVIIDKAKEAIAGIDNFSVLEIQEVNIRPHIPVVGTKTMDYACDKGLGIINGDSPCSYPGCNLAFKEHKGDTVLFFKLTSIVSKEKAEQAFNSLADVLESNKIDGVAFVQENEECVFT
jgi:hypothetical protein